jgi:hypothetical protein
MSNVIDLFPNAKGAPDFEEPSILNDEVLEASAFMETCFMFKDAIRRGVIVDDDVILNLFKGEPSMTRNQIPNTPKDFKHIQLRQHAERQRKARAARRQLTGVGLLLLLIAGLIVKFGPMIDAL